MWDNNALDIAKRRNARAVNRTEFFRALHENCHLGKDRISLLDVAYSLEFEACVFREFSSRRERGECRRVRDAEWELVEQHVNGARLKALDCVTVILNNYPDFSFTIKTKLLVGKLLKLLLFDGDTIYVSVDDFSVGLLIDRHESTNANLEYEYDIEFWGIDT
jgi:hypothetical protein